MNRILMVSRDSYFITGVKDLLENEDEPAHSLDIVSNLTMLEAVTNYPNTNYRMIIIDYPSLDNRMSRFLLYFTHVFHKSSIILLSGANKGFMLDISPTVKDFSYVSRKCFIPSVAKLFRSVDLVDREYLQIKDSCRQFIRTTRSIKSVDLTIIILLAKEISYKDIAIELKVSDKFIYRRMLLISKLLGFKCKNDFLYFVSGFKIC